MHRFLIAALAALTLGGCALQYPVAQVYPKDAKIVGIADHLQAGQTLDVMLVHGMGRHGGNWAMNEVGLIAKQLGVAAPKKLNLILQPGLENLVSQAVLQVPLPGSPSTLVPVRVTAVQWSVLTEPAKRTLCYDESVKTPACAGSPDYQWNPRAKFNREFIDSLGTDHLVDPITYAGENRAAMMEQMERSILAAFAASAVGAQGAPASPGPQGDLIMITESLGSIMVFDTLNQMINSAAGAGRSEEAATLRRAVAEQTAKRTRSIFMAANQLPLFIGARQPVGKMRALETTPGQRDPLASFLRLRGDKGAFSAQSDTGLQIVAFTDPNDVLSYTLVPWAEQRPDHKSFNAIDVAVSNDGSFPGIGAPLAENPLAAHTTYLDNCQVMQIVVTGKPRTSRCP